MRPSARGWAAVLSLGLLVCAGVGCKAKDMPAVKQGEAKPELHLYAFGDEDSNRGHALQVVVRAVEEKDFIEDSYSDIALLVASPDETVIDVLTVFPGEPTVRELVVEELPETVGVYGLFNDTKNSDWKLFMTTRRSAGGGLAIEQASEAEVRVLEFAAGYGNLRDLSDPEQERPPESESESAGSSD